MVEILVVVTCWHLLVFSFWNWISLDSSSNMVDNCPLSLDGNFNRLFLKLNPVFILVVGSPHSLVQCGLYYCSSLAAWAEICLNFWEINFGECPLKKQTKERLNSLYCKWHSLESNKVASNQSKLCCQARPWHTSKRQTLRWRECWLREVFRLIAVAIDEIKKITHEL